MPENAAHSRPLNGRLAVDNMAPQIQKAARAARHTMTIDLADRAQMAASAFDQLLESCRSALDDSGNPNADIYLLAVPVPLKKMHHQVAARHDRAITTLEDNSWLLQPR